MLWTELVIGGLLDLSATEENIFQDSWNLLRRPISRGDIASFASATWSARLGGSAVMREGFA